MHFRKKINKFNQLTNVLFIFNLILIPSHSFASESDFFKGIMGAIIVNGIIQEVKKNKEPIIVRKQVTFVNPVNTSLQNQSINANKKNSYQSIPQKAFKSQLPSVRYNIQGELMKMGYYHGAIDGYWGLKTEHAISSYATDIRELHLLTSIDGTISLFNQILYNPKSNSYSSTQRNHSNEISNLESQISSLLKEVRRLEIQLSQLKGE